MLVNCLLYLHSLSSRFFKETKIKTPSNGKQNHEALLTARQNVKNLREKEFLESLNWLNVQEKYLRFIASDIFKFYDSQYHDKFNEVYCPVDDNDVATRSCNKILKLPSGKSKLGMQSLSYVGPSTWNKLPNNLKTKTRVSSFKHNIKKYFLKKLSEAEAEMYSYD